MSGLLILGHREGHAAALRDELRRVLPRGQPEALGPGALAVSGADGLPHGTALAFAAWALPEARPFAAPSVSAGADAVIDALVTRLKDHEGPVRLLVFATGEGSPARARLVAAETQARLKDRLRRLHRQLRTDEGALGRDEALVQVLLTGADKGFVSALTPGEAHAHRRLLSPYAGGEVAVPRDIRPPSRAYQKLVEAQTRLGVKMKDGETVVDLGASPGGWSFVALEQGAQVTAIDRSPLRDDLRRNAQLSFVKGDAFSYRPTQRVDWLVCDLIAFPERTVQLLKDWLGGGLCDRFVVTVKFRGTEDYALVEQVKAVLAEFAGEYWLRALTHNKNELTAMGRARAAPAAVLFDMDGVLVKSEEIWFQVVSEAGERFRGSPIGREEFAPTFGQGTAADLPAFGLKTTVAELDAFYAEAFPRHLARVWVDPQAREVLTALRARGVKTAVVTNTVEVLARKVLAAAGLLELFDFVGCADQVPRAKPAPDLVVHVCGQLGVAPARAWMIGDSRYDREAARGAGVYFVGMHQDGDVRVASLGALLAIPGLRLPSEEKP
jgi:HAD superfamily hydrolase (TIGR01509 family)